MGRQPRIRRNNGIHLNHSDDFGPGLHSRPFVMSGHPAALRPPGGAHPHPVLSSHTEGRKKSPGQMARASRRKSTLRGASGRQDGWGRALERGSAVVGVGVVVHPVTLRRSRPSPTAGGETHPPEHRALRLPQPPLVPRDGRSTRSPGTPAGASLTSFGVTPPPAGLALRAPKDDGMDHHPPRACSFLAPSRPPRRQHPGRRQRAPGPHARAFPNDRGHRGHQGATHLGTFSDPVLLGHESGVVPTAPA